MAPLQSQEEYLASGWYDQTFAGLQSADYARPDPGVVWLATMLPEGARVAEPGCGAGRNTLVLASSGLCVTAFDTSACGIQRVNEFAAAEGYAANVTACQRNLRDGF